MKRSAFDTALEEATRSQAEPLTADARALMARHWEMVKSWNRRVNLTAITDDVEAAWLHYADSLQALPLLPPAGTLVDMGSGAGYPGIPIAIAKPAYSVTLVEPRRKRASFLEVVVARLPLDNVRVRESVSTDEPDQQYSALVTRATFSDPAALAACLRWVKPGGSVVALRSAEPGTQIPSSERHIYSLRGHPRVLEVWKR